jgi:hypothetical protein
MGSFEKRISVAYIGARSHAKASHLRRQMTDAVEISCSGFGKAVIEHM